MPGGGLMQLVAQPAHDWLHGNTSSAHPANLQAITKYHLIDFEDGVGPPLTGVGEDMSIDPCLIQPPYNPKLDKMARRIQTAWRQCIANPKFTVCRRRLRREFDKDLDPPSMYSAGFCTNVYDKFREWKQQPLHNLDVRQLERMKLWRREGRYEYTGDMLKEAADSANLLCLKYAHENGDRCDAILSKLYENSFKACIVESVGDPFERLDIFRVAYAIKTGQSPASISIDQAQAWMSRRKFACMRYLHEQGYPWCATICLHAAVCGELECLQYAHENGCPWDVSATKGAALHGHLDCLSYAHENGCPWDADTCREAANNEHLDCLSYAHENGCPWDAGTCREAAEIWNLRGVKGRGECLRYALEHGCPWDTETCELFSKWSNMDTLACLLRVTNDSQHALEGTWKSMLNSPSALFDVVKRRGMRQRTSVELSDMVKEANEKACRRMSATTLALSTKRNIMCLMHRVQRLLVGVVVATMSLTCCLDD